MKTNEELKSAKKGRVISLIKRFAALTDSEREAIANQIQISNPEGRVLSSRNQTLIFLQSSPNIVDKLTVVAGFKQWQKYGRKIKKGQKGMYIAVPANNKENPDNKPNLEENDTPDFYIYKSVFDVTQTEAIN